MKKFFCSTLFSICVLMQNFAYCSHQNQNAHGGIHENINIQQGDRQRLFGQVNDVIIAQRMESTNHSNLAMQNIHLGTNQPFVLNNYHSRLDILSSGLLALLTDALSLTYTSFFSSFGGVFGQTAAKLILDAGVEKVKQILIPKNLADAETKIILIEKNIKAFTDSKILNDTSLTLAKQTYKNDKDKFKIEKEKRTLALNHEKYCIALELWGLKEFLITLIRKNPNPNLIEKKIIFTEYGQAISTIHKGILLLKVENTLLTFLEELDNKDDYDKKLKHEILSYSLLLKQEKVKTENNYFKTRSNYPLSIQGLLAPPPLQQPNTAISVNG